VRDIRRKTRRRFSAEEKIRIVLDGLRGEVSVAELEALGPTLLQFYETGRVSNPCDGPCDENDLAD